MIYIVEDDANIRKMLVFAIAREGYEIKEFPDASTLYDSLEKEMAQLLILDIMLPGEDGFTVLEKLRGNPSTKRLPVIILTAKNSEIDKLRGLDGGADDYVTKPFGIVIEGKPPKLPICKCSSKATVFLSNISLEPSKCLAGPLPTGNITASYSFNNFFQVSTSNLLTL